MTPVAQDARSYLYINEIKEVLDTMIVSATREINDSINKNDVEGVFINTKYKTKLQELQNHFLEKLRRVSNAES